MALGTFDGIACLGNGRLEGVNVQLLLREDDRLALGVEEVTFLTSAVLRTVSLTWLSHMPHIMPSTFKIVSII